MSGHQKQSTFQLVYFQCRTWVRIRSQTWIPNPMATQYYAEHVSTTWTMQGFIRPVAHVGSGDPVRVLRLYTTNTLDEACSIYC